MNLKLTYYNEELGGTFFLLYIFGLLWIELVYLKKVMFNLFQPGRTRTEASYTNFQIQFHHSGSKLCSPLLPNLPPTSRPQISTLTVYPHISSSSPTPSPPSGLTDLPQGTSRPSGLQQQGADEVGDSGELGQLVGST